MVLTLTGAACDPSEIPDVIPTRSASTPEVALSPSTSQTPFEQSMRSSFRAPFFAVYGLTLKRDTIWAVGSHGYQRLRFADNGPGLMPIGDAVEVDKTLMGVDAGPTGVWAVGGGDGGDPYGELLRLGPTKVARTISLPESSPYDVLASGGVVFVADAAGSTLDVVYPDDLSAPEGYRLGESAPIDGEGVISVIEHRGHRYALSSGGRGSWARLNPGTGEVELLVDVGRCPIDIQVGAGSVWVADYCKDVVRRFSPDGELLDEIAVGNRPTSLAFEYRTLWVGFGGGVVNIAPDRNKITARWDVPGRVQEVLVERGSLLVAHKRSVTRIMLEL